jgi:predicted HTH domain antitoxin
MKKPVALRIPDHLLSLADLRARKERVDKASALRQILYEGAESYALRLLSRGELSLSRSAELLGLSPGEVLDLAAQRGVEIGGTLAQHRAGREGRT